MSETVRLNKRQRREAAKAQSSANATVDGGQSTLQGDTPMDTIETVQLAPVAEPTPIVADPLARRADETPEQHIARLQTYVADQRKQLAVAKVSSGSLGENIASKLEGQTLTITIDLSRTLRKSASGKSNIVATTGGNVDLGNGLKLGVNCYRT